MKLSDLVDIQRFRESLKPCDKGLFSIWKDTAIEIGKSNHSSILRTFDIYQDIPEKELNVEQLISYFEDLLMNFTSLEDKKKLISTEAFQFKTFT